MMSAVPPFENVRHGNPFYNVIERENRPPASGAAGKKFCSTSDDEVFVQAHDRVE